VDGVQPNVPDVEPLASDMPTQLQHIIERINAKAEGHASVSAQRPCLDALNRLSSVVSAESVQSSGTSTAMTAVAKMTGAGADETPDTNLQRVIAQINARLESQERSKQLALQSVALMAAASRGHSDVYPPAAAGRVVGRSVGDQATAGLSVLGQSRVDATPITAVSPATYSGGLAAMAAAQPKLTVSAANMSAAGSGYVALATGGRSAAFAVAPELVGGSSALAGMQYPSSASIVSQSPYLRGTLPGVVDAASIAAVDPSAIVASPQVKYIPYQSQSRDMSMMGAATAGSGLYPLQSVMPADAVATGYTLVNSGAAVKRPLNDVMLYMVDKRPRYY